MNGLGVRFAGVLVSTALVGLSACGPASDEAGPMSAAQEERVAEAVRAQLGVFTDAGNQGDAALAASMMAEDAEFVDFARPLIGRAATVEWLDELYGRYTSWEFVWDEVDVDVLGPEAALATAIGSLERTLPDGRLQRSERNLFLTALFTESGGSWLMKRGHLSGAVSSVAGG